MPKRKTKSVVKKVHGHKSPPKEKKGDYVSFKNASRAEEIAFYYGFTPMQLPSVTKEDVSMTKEMYEHDQKPRHLPENNECYFDICAEEKVAILRTYFDQNMQNLPQPVSIFLDGHFATNPSKKNADSETRFELEMIGTTKSMAEAVLVKAAFEILREEGFENLYVDLNSIGDRDSIARFYRELVAYYRKNINSLEDHCRQAMKRDVFECLECENEKCQAIKQDAPVSMAYLSELSKIHFREVLEYLESMSIPYRINPFLVGNRHFTTHTIFQIRSLNDAENLKAPSYPLAVGVRYNSLAKKVGLKRDVPAVGITIAYKKRGRGEGRHTLKIKKSKIFFIQLGFEAKLRSLKVVEMLRLEDIPIHQSLSRDKLAGQLSLAESMKIPYAVIMGQKEAVEGTVIVRDMFTRSQETVVIDALPGYLRKLKYKN